MSFIQTVPEPDATGKLRGLYETERTNRGYVPNHVKAAGNAGSSQRRAIHAL